MPHPSFFEPRNQQGLFNARPQVAQVDEPEEKNERRRNFFDKFAEIFVGQSDPRLSDEQNQRVRNDALTQAGLAIMAAGGRTGLDRASLLTAMGEGAQAGRASGRQGRRSQVFGEIAGKDPSVALPQFRELFIEAAQSGDVDGMKAIATIINAMEAAASKVAGEGALIYRTQGDDIVAINPRTAEEVARIKGTPSARAGGTQPTIVFDPNTGENVLAVFDREKMAYVSLGANGRVILNAEPKSSAVAVDPYVAGIAPFVGPSYANNLKILEELGPPNILEHMLDENDLLRWMAPSDAQRFNAAGDDIISVLILIRSGRQASDRERTMLRRALVPRPGDKPVVTAEKIARLKSQGKILMEASAEGRSMLEMRDMLEPGIAGHIDSVIGMGGLRGVGNEDGDPIFNEFNRR